MELISKSIDPNNNLDIEKRDEIIKLVCVPIIIYSKCMEHTSGDVFLLKFMFKKNSEIRECRKQDYELEYIEKQIIDEIEHSKI